MSISIAQSRQQLSSLISAAQQTPQVITKHNAPVAVLVSADYFKLSEAAIKPATDDFYSLLIGLREAHPPLDNSGIEARLARGRLSKGQSKRHSAWTRDNAFADPV